VNGRPVVFDISRLVTRFTRPVPNGIDRVDLSYAEHFLSAARGGLGAILGPTGPRAVGNAMAGRIASAIREHWREEDPVEDDVAYQRVRAFLRGALRTEAGAAHRLSNAARARRSIARLLRQGQVVGRHGLFPGRDIRSAPEGAIYVNACQFPLWLDWHFRWLNGRKDVKAVFFIHDLLPIQYPEFFPPAEASRHARRFEVFARYGAGAIVASEATRDALVDHLERHGHTAPPILLLPIPVAASFRVDDDAPVTADDDPYFVVVGTIEPRKNHLMLLAIWRELVTLFRARTPKLVLVGMRGWDNENVVDMLERCHAIKPFVFESSGLSTPALNRLVRGARAVLMPTLAEGYGLPVVEAAAAGVRLIVSDIPAFHSFDNDYMTQIDPLDGPAWREAIVAHIPRKTPGPCANPTFPQAVNRSWAWHFEHVEQFIHAL